MGIRLALDCGGTKVAGILYDENLRRVAVCVTGSVRANTTPPELIRRHTQALIDGLGLAGLEIGEVTGACDGTLLDGLERVCRIGRREITGELELGLAAAGMFGDGILALAGTGATVFARAGGESFVAGGYGAAVADEGSGYDIGRAGLIAAIRYAEKRGPATALADLLPRRFGFAGAGELRRAVFSIYGKTDRSPAAAVADCCAAVVRAAAEGDAVSAAILCEKGRLMGEQTRYLITENALPPELPVAISGSVWRGNPVYFQAFRGTLAAACPGREIVVPRIQPVLGALARGIYERTGGFTEADAARLREEYPEFGYDP